MRPKIKYTKTDPSRVSYDEQSETYYIQEGHVEGKSSLRKFRLGSNEFDARERALRIRKLWKHMQAEGYKAWQSSKFVDSDGCTSSHRYEKLAADIAQGDWTSISLDTMNNMLVSMSRPDLAQSHPFVDEVDEIGELRERTKGGGSGLHKAIEEFAAHVRTTKIEIETGQTSDWGDVLGQQVERLMDATPDMSFSSFKTAQIAAIVKYWKNRPCRKGTTKRISVKTVSMQIKALRYFCKWLKKNRGWRMPDDFDEVVQCKINDLLFDHEIAALAKGIPHYSVLELTTIFRYATRWERLFVILAVNCGFAQAEIASLRASEIFLHENPPKIKRIRKKKRVYGEVGLWAETVSALRWVLARRKAQGGFTNDCILILSDEKRELTYTRIANLWKSILRRIKKDVPDFQELPFTSLRDTAGQLVQDCSDEFTANSFLFHGRSENTRMLTHYTNKDFGKVFAANAKVREKLQPMVDAAPGAWDGETTVGGSIISLDTVEKIKQMSANGVGPTQIAKQLKISRPTVYRHRKQPSEQ